MNEKLNLSKGNANLANKHTSFNKIGKDKYNVY